uniref:Neugrin n=1 Tax=Eptatretus burgeri TaxID=7764 RepID=A0A8C4QL42_EPTBU
MARLLARFSQLVRVGRVVGPCGGLGNGQQRQLFKKGSIQDDQPWGEQEDEVDYTDEELEVKKILRIRRKAMQKARCRRFFSPGSSTRQLTWDEICYLRFLAKEEPQTWTLENLASSFSVSTECVKRVLVSNEVPSEKQQISQDLMVIKEREIMRQMETFGKGIPMWPEWDSCPDSGVATLTLGAHQL